MGLVPCGLMTLHNKIPGGLAVHQTLKSLQAKYPKVDIRAALIQGAKVEMEHTTDHQIAIEIAMDHLMEDPEYYTKLRQIEETIKINKIVDQSRVVGRIVLQSGSKNHYTIVDANNETLGGFYR